MPELWPTLGQDAARAKSNYTTDFDQTHWCRPRVKCGESCWRCFSLVVALLKDTNERLMLFWVPRARFRGNLIYSIYVTLILTYLSFINLNALQGLSRVFTRIFWILRCTVMKRDIRNFCYTSFAMYQFYILQFVSRLTLLSGLNTFWSCMNKGDKSPKWKLPYVMHLHNIWIKIANFKRVTNVATVVITY